MSAALHQMPVFDLANDMRQQFAPGLAGLAHRHGVERGELDGIAILVTDEALAGYDESKSTFSRRWWFTCVRHFWRLGWASVESDGGTAGGAAEADDPSEILEARQTVWRLAAAGLVEGALGAAPANERTERRHRARLRAAAEIFLRADGAQGEIF